MARNLETPHDRALRAAQDICYRLGGKHYISLDGLDPPKPKGMHWRTYERKIKSCEAHEAVCNQYLMRFEACFATDFDSTNCAMRIFRKGGNGVQGDQVVDSNTDDVAFEAMCD